MAKGVIVRIVAINVQATINGRHRPLTNATAHVQTTKCQSLAATIVEDELELVTPFLEESNTMCATVRE
jgi:hypothetical protein